MTPPPPPPSARADRDLAAPPPPPKRSIVPAIVTGSLAVIAAGVGTGFGIAALNHKSSFNSHPTNVTANSGENEALVSDMGFGIAITLGVTSIILFTTTRNEATSPLPESATPAPAAAPGSAPADAIPDPSKLTLTTRVNGTQVQHKGLDDMIFDVPSIIAYVSSWTKLEPGDVISTGTPEGVGFARKPPLWLKPGDTVDVEISSVGILRNPIIAES